MTTAPQVLVAFVGKQDPDNAHGHDGPILSAVAALPFTPDRVVLLFAEGASDRADDRDDTLAEGTQELRAETTAERLRARHPHLSVRLQRLTADPVDARALHAATAHALRDVREERAHVHLLVAGGTPAMREALSALHAGEYFAREHVTAWYQSDRGALRPAVPVMLDAMALQGAALAVRVGEYTVAREQLTLLRHPGTADALTLLHVLQDVAVREYPRAQRRLEAWHAPAALAAWRQEAIQAVRHFRTPHGKLMHFWNDVQRENPRDAVLAYATLLEVAVVTLAAAHGCRVKDTSRDSILGALAERIGPIPEALDARSGEPRALYNLRSGIIHAGERATEAEAARARDAATALLRSYPAPEESLRSFLRAPHRNAFAPNRRAELAEILRHWLGGPVSQAT